MDVRFYPAAAGNTIPGEPSNLDLSQCLGYYSYNKFAGNNNYMNMADPSHAFSTSNETFHTPSLGDEEFEIPPITPPPETDPTLGLTDVVSAFQDLNDPLPSQGNEFTPHFPPQSLELPSITISRSIMDQDGGLLSNGLSVVSVEKRAAVDSGKKPKTPKKKKKKDPNEPQKPVSAYALFFRDTQAAIKGQNPNATFGEVSKIVASMWDSLGEEQKQVYKRKTEAAKKEYLKALAAYRASLVSKAAAESAEAQTMRSVQQTLASTSLSTSLLMNPSLSQHASVSASTQTLPRAIAPKPMRLPLQGNQLVTSVTIAPNMSTNIATPMGTSMGTTMVPTPPSPQLSPPLQPQQHQIQQMQQHQLQHFQQHQMQQQMQQQMQHQQIQQHQHQMQQHQMQQQQMHHQMHQQQIQQHMQQQLQQQLQQQQIQQQLQQMQLQHMQKQQIQQLQQQHPPQHSPPQHSPVTSQSVVASQITSPVPTRSSPQPAQQQQQSPLQTQAQTQVLPQEYLHGVGCLS
ncbi:TOX high mobility group box family member 3 isoform X4 [Heterodontus francisci]|uniref:TOX high mobility group box family member 3 isoform X4 n=1 Tax=Heterodontus francisci TaxID=7792 RepID=UPI00355B294A